MNKPLVIEYYTDILCCWAWIAQRRVDELNKALGNKIEFKHYYVDVFGDVSTKMKTQWLHRGGYEGFAEHVEKSVSTFEDAIANPNIWTHVRPVTSANAHLILKAVEVSYGKDKSIDMALKIRQSFFVDALDIGKLDVLYGIISEAGLNKKQIESSIQDGSAIAALMHDYQKSKQQNLKGTPSFVMDGGRQTLYGNVGYRVLLANIEELLKKPEHEASWC